MTAALVGKTDCVMRSTFLKFALLLTLSFLLLIIPGAAHAQTSVAPAAESYQRVSVNSISGQSPHAASLAIYNFSHAMSCILIGQSPIAPCLEYKMVKDATGMVKSVPYLSTTNTSNGLLGVSLSMVGEVISKPPIHSSLFIANLGEQIGIKSANAQVSGSGSGVLAPIFKLWEVSRNISYLAMIVIFIGVGFMVMFRQKLNPQTVVSVQLALPGLIIGLVMITFSYFVASLISDVAFVGTNVVGYYFSLADPSIKEPTQLPLTTSLHGGWPIVNPPQGSREANVLTIFGRFTSILPSDAIAKAIDSIWVYLDDPTKGIGFFQGDKGGFDPSKPVNFQLDAAEALLNVSRFIIYQLLSPLNAVFPGYGAAIAAGTGFVGGSISATSTIGFGLGFLASIILIYSMFKLLLRLIQNLLSIIFLTIAAPFYFLATALPGKQSLLPNWFFNMLCNVLAFPAVFAVFYFVAFILGPAANPDSDLFRIGAGAQLTGTSTFPLLGGLTSDFLNRLLAFGALIALPSVPDIICRVVGKPNQLGALAAGAVGGAIGAGQRYQGQAGGFLPGIAQNTGRLRGDRGMLYDPRTVTTENLTFGHSDYAADSWARGKTVGQTVGWRRPINEDESARVSQSGQFDRMRPGFQAVGRGIGGFLGLGSNAPTAVPPVTTPPPTTGGAGPGGRVNPRTRPGP